MKKGAILLTVIALVVVAGIVVGWKLTSSGAKNGPLVLPQDVTSSVGVPIPQNTRFSYGLLAVKNKGDKPITLDRLELVNATEGIHFLGAYTLPLPNDKGIGFTKGFSLARHFNNQIIAPHTEVQIVIGVALKLTGRHQFTAVSVNYHAGSSSFTNQYPVSARLCTPVSQYRNNCPGLLHSTSAQS